MNAKLTSYNTSCYSMMTIEPYLRGTMKLRKSLGKLRAKISTLFAPMQLCKFETSEICWLYI